MNDAVLNADGPESLLSDLVGKGSLSDGLLSVVPIASASAVSEFAASDRIFGTSSSDILVGTQSNNTIFAGGGSDAVSVGGGNNIIFATDTRSRGSFENDYISLGAGQDSVVLGDERGSFYIEDGWQDSAYIAGFKLEEDRLFLHGDRALYTVESTATGSWILFGDRSDTAIAFLENVQNFSLQGDSVAFLPETQPADAPPAPPAPEDSPENDPEDASAEALVQSLSFYLQLGVPEFRQVAGGIGDDSLVGSNASDQILGFGGRDYAFGGGGADVFVLGSFGGAYYTQSGWEDSIYIDDFTVGEDQLQLSGSIGQYSTEATDTGLWLYSEGDAIAFFNGIQSLDLTSAQYRDLSAT